MNRQHRAQIAQETLTILETGVYTLPDGGTISLRADLERACAGTVCYQPEMYPALLAGLVALPESTSPTIQVLNCTTLAAARMLATQFPSVACLNFASAKNPGGGFLSGSQAQEESLARASGLYASLVAAVTFAVLDRSGETLRAFDEVFRRGPRPAVPG